MAPDNTIRNPHATLPGRKSVHKAGSTAKPPAADSKNNVR